MFTVKFMPVEDSDVNKWVQFSYPKVYVNTGDIYRLDTKNDFKHFSLPTIRTLEVQGTDTGVKVIDNNIIEELDKTSQGDLIKINGMYYKYSGYHPKVQIYEHKDLTPKIKQWEKEMQEFISNTIQTVDWNSSPIKFLKFLRTICSKPFEMNKFSDSEHIMYMDYKVTNDSIEIYSYLTDNAVYQCNRMNKIFVLTEEQ